MDPAVKDMGEDVEELKKMVEECKRERIKKILAKELHELENSFKVVNHFLEKHE
jgi:hypothetical protein